MKQKFTLEEHAKNLLKIKLNLDKLFKRMKSIEMIIWIVDMVLLLLLLTTVLLSLWICIIRSFVNKFIYFFYTLGFILFVVTYFLIRDAKNIDDDGTIAIAVFIVIVCLILVKRMRDANARKEYP